MRENLYAALEVLQAQGARFSEDPSREMTLIGQYFWVDALCVDQSDPLERGHQVDLMAEIFSGATCAVSWLGSEADDSEYAMRAISEGVNASWDLTRLAASLHQLLNRPYWRRVWTVPEFILAENMLLLCGRRGAWFARLSASLELIRGLLLPYRTRHSQVDLDLAILCDSREQWHSTIGMVSEAFSLDSLMSQFFKASCSDLRDRVYALLPLARVGRGGGTAWASPHHQQLPYQHPSLSLNPSPPSTPPPPLLADYTIDEERLYYRVLGRMRHSPSLIVADQWRRFRFTLSSALRLPRHRSSFLIREALYNLTEHRRAATARNPHLLQTLDEREAAYFLGDLAEHLQKPLGSFRSRAGGRGPGRGDKPGALVVEQARKAGDVVEHFRFFPRDEDPGSWRDFEDLVREALALADRALSFVGVSFVEWAPDAGRWGFEEEREQEKKAFQLLETYQSFVV